MMSQGFKRGSKGRTISSTRPDITTVFHACSYGSFIEIQSNLRRTKLHRKNHGSNFLGGIFSNRVNPNILKDGFCSKADPSIFTAIALVLLGQSNETS